jgi:hypothetical protein
MMQAFLLTTWARPHDLKIPEDKFYLGDVDYACRPSILPAFRSTMHHLNEFSAKH